MIFEKDLADFLHKIIDGLHIGERGKADLHTELAVNTAASSEGEEKKDAPE